MLGIISVGEIKRPETADNIVGQTTCLGIVNLDIGSDTTAVAHDPAAYRAEFVGETVGDARNAAILVAMAIVDSLYESSGGDIVSEAIVTFSDPS